MIIRIESGIKMSFEASSQDFWSWGPEFRCSSMLYLKRMFVEQVMFLIPGWMVTEESLARLCEVCARTPHSSESEFAFIRHGVLSFIIIDVAAAATEVRTFALRTILPPHGFEPQNEEAFSALYGSVSVSGMTCRSSGGWWGSLWDWQWVQVTWYRRISFYLERLRLRLFHPGARLSATVLPNLLDNKISIKYDGTGSPYNSFRTHFSLM